MTKIDKKDIENIQILEEILKSKKINSIKIKKDNYEIEVSIKQEEASLLKNQTQVLEEEKKIIKEEIKKENIVTSPMVGVIYLAPETTKPTFVKEGQKVKKGDTLMLIEAMKTFNEIKSPKDGVIKKIFVLNSQPVEFGETLVIFE